MLFMNALVPFTMIGFGKLFLNNAPGKINLGFGYRTSMSMKNKDTWEFAHRYIGKLWHAWGIALLLLSIIPLFFVIGKDEDTVGTLGGIICAVQMVFLAGSIFPTEKALRKTFDKNGNRRKTIDSQKI